MQETTEQGVCKDDDDGRHVFVICAHGRSFPTIMPPTMATMSTMTATMLYGPDEFTVCRKCLASRGCDVDEDDPFTSLRSLKLSDCYRTMQTEKS